MYVRTYQPECAQALNKGFTYVAVRLAARVGGIGGIGGTGIGGIRTYVRIFRCVMSGQTHVFRSAAGAEVELMEFRLSTTARVYSSGMLHFFSRVP